MPAPRAQPPPPNAVLLIDNGTVVTVGAAPSVRPGHSVLIEDGRIARIAPAGRFARHRGRRIDASRRIILPGLINAHTHAYSALVRGTTARLRPAETFPEVLERLWWRLDSALTLEDCRLSALLTFIDSIRHGTTTVFDHHASPRAVEGSLETIAEAAALTGVRACLCYEVSDRDGPRIARAGLEENAAFLRRCRENSTPFLRGLFGLHASFTLSDRTLRAAAALGREAGAGFHLHVAEAESDQEETRRRSGCRVVERLERFGILGERSLAAHAVHVNRREMDLLARTRTAVVHNPQSNLNNAVGIADLAGLTARGVSVGLGTDAMTANLLEEARVALWALHQRTGNPSAAAAPVAGALFLENPRIMERIFGWHPGLDEGSPADVIIVDYDPPTPLVPGNVHGHLLFGASQAAVDTTIVGGRVLMEGRRLRLDLDEGRLNARARERAQALWKRL